MRRLKVFGPAGDALGDADFVHVAQVIVARGWVRANIKRAAATNIGRVCCCRSNLNPVHKMAKICSASGDCNMIPSGSTKSVRLVCASTFMNEIKRVIRPMNVKRPVV